MILFFPPEIPPPAPLQTQDGSAVAKTDTTVVFFFFPFWPGGCRLCRNFFFLFMQRRSTNTKQTPDGKSQHKPANRDLKGGWGRGKYTTKLATSSTDTATLVCFLGTKTTIFCPLHPRYVNKTKRKKKTNGEKAYIYTFVQKRHMEPRHYWCSVYTQTRCRESHDRLFELCADFILPRQ